MSIFRQLGVEPIINACGTVTRLGGAPMPTPVLDAFAQAAAESVPLERLQAAASRQIANVTGADAGLVTCGAAAALTLGTAAILARHNLARIEKLPCTDGFPNEMIIAREQRSGYDHSVRAAGATLVEVGFNEIIANAGVRRTEVWEYEAAITHQTAGIVYVHAHDSCPGLSEIVAMAHEHDLPVLVDAAGELPPRSNLKDIPTTGTDLVCFSGGKAIHGPQSTGILCGRRDLVSSAALQMLDMDDHLELWDPPDELFDPSRVTGIPRHGIGRGLKVSKEQIVALLTALDLFASGEFDRQLIEYRRILNTVADGLSTAKANCRMLEPLTQDRWPLLEITVDSAALGRSAMEVCRALRGGSPPVYVGHAGLHEGRLQINPVCLTAAVETELTRRLLEELS
ncbi:MAG: aminotransferase class V-fold PLP-dependent enzyme [Fuerstiella sp.]|jgi:L-seryl-tRNA(Ser) seleniumtransferase|nr:aminotransferase class V-fold PLP-dependent enzyme [Fuerstiella sp.]MCP4509335.1 aminotransferase class V-fold PLP-dependent enzyme [Fuerstiella sp.]MDG2129384.1 aminotransferase class V-fold PLP-dependent enzyme [Fuerstiella sp.]